MGGVGSEAALSRKGLFDPVEHPVEGAGHPPHSRRWVPVSNAAAEISAGRIESATWEILTRGRSVRPVSRYPAMAASTSVMGSTR